MEQVLVSVYHGRFGLWQLSAFGRQVAWGRVQGARPSGGIARQIKAQANGFQPKRQWPALRAGKWVVVYIAADILMRLVNGQ